jgi:Cell cycle regulated microtubule associated protein
MRIKPASTELTTEEKEILEIKKHGTFKARRLNKRLFTSVLGVPHVERMPSTTDFMEFKLRIASRENLKPSEVKTSEELAFEECRKKFKARKLNKKILSEVPKQIEKSISEPQFKEFKFKSEERV